MCIARGDSRRHACEEEQIRTTGLIPTIDDSRHVSIVVVRPGDAVMLFTPEGISPEDVASTLSALKERLGDIDFCLVGNISSVLVKRKDEDEGGSPDN
jgi:hypothetical protein